MDADILPAILRGAALAAIGLAWVVLLTRIVGLRSFSKMTTFDFVMTVATGSLLAGLAQATTAAEAAQPAAAMAGLFAVQVAAAKLRARSNAAERLMQNEPAILMRDGVIDEAALARTRVARSDLIAKLREANVLDFASVRAVVLETTGDISVLHGEGLDPALLAGTRAERA